MLLTDSKGSAASCAGTPGSSASGVIVFSPKRASALARKAPAAVKVVGKGMSDTNHSTTRSVHSPSVDSSDEVNYYDPARMDSTDIEGSMGLALDAEDLGGEQYASELSHFRLSEPGAAHTKRASSPDSNAQTPQKYVQLGNYAGLSGPSANSRQQDDQGSNKGSFISSLSSHSLEHHGDRSEQYPQGSKQRPSVSSISEDEGSAEHHEDGPAAAAQAVIQYSEEDKGRMRLVFNQIFSSVMPNFASPIGLGNGSDHGGSVARENIYYREKVKVNTSLPAKETKFKDKTRLVQTIKFHQGAIWAMKFSPCGAYLCTAGQDLHVVIWSVGALPADAQESKGGSGDGQKAGEKAGAGDAKAATEPGGQPQAQAQRRSFDFRDSRKAAAYLSESSVELKPFIHPVPYRVLEGHTGDVIDLAWSKSKFILSASTDKTVCLWHVSRSECLQFFRHPDIVTAVEFHPAHDRYYISGCFDRKLRVWDIIPDGIVQEWTQTTDTITSICFSPDGKTVAGGLIQGKVYFYDLVDFDQLKYKTQMSCRNSGGKYSSGTKVTGMCYRPLNTNFLNSLDPASEQGSGAYKWRKHTNNHRPSSMQLAAQLLVTTNDSRVRLCRLDDYSQICKYKGLTNKSMQIKASFSQDGGHVICGSETGAVFVWATLPKKNSGIGSLLGGKNDRNSGYESFDCTSGTDVAATVAVFAPVDALLLHLHRNVDVLTTSGAFSSTTPPPAAVDPTLPKPHGGAGGGEHSPVREGIAATAGGGAATPPPVSPRPESVRASVDYSTRVVVTADYEGCLRVFFRLS